MGCNHLMMVDSTWHPTTVMGYYDNLYIWKLILCPITFVDMKNEYGTITMISLLQRSQLLIIYASHDKNSRSDGLTCVTFTPKDILRSLLIIKLRKISPISISYMWVPYRIALILVKTWVGWSGEPKIYRLCHWNCHLTLFLCWCLHPLVSRKIVSNYVFTQDLCILSDVPWAHYFNLFVGCLLICIFPVIWQIGS